MGKLPNQPTNPTNPTTTLGGPGKDGQEVDHVEGIRGKPRNLVQFIGPMRSCQSRSLCFSENHINMYIYIYEYKLQMNP